MSLLPGSACYEADPLSRNTLSEFIAGTALRQLFQTALEHACS